MSADRIEQAKRHAERSRMRMESTLHAVQSRLHPKVLANEAWDGVRLKGGDIADGAMDAVKKRPVTVSAVIGAVALFLAREPLKRAIVGLFSNGDRKDGIVTTTIAKSGKDYKAAAPIVPMAGAQVKEGVN